MLFSEKNRNRRHIWEQFRTISSKFAFHLRIIRERQFVRTMASNASIITTNRFESFQSDDECDQTGRSAGVKAPCKVTNKNKNKKSKAKKSDEVEKKPKQQQKQKKTKDIDGTDRNFLNDKTDTKIDNNIASVSETKKDADRSINWLDLCEDDYDDRAQTMSTAVEPPSTMGSDGRNDRRADDGDFILATRKKLPGNNLFNTVGKHPRDIFHRPPPLMVKAISRCHRNSKRTDEAHNGSGELVKQTTGSADSSSNWKRQEKDRMPRIHRNDQCY